LPAAVAGELPAALDEVNNPVVLRKMTKAIESFREIEEKLQNVREKSNEI
jgi:hypothetical protein